MIRFILRAIFRHPSAVFGGVASAMIVGAIFVNAGYMQDGSHPAPLLAGNAQDRAPAAPATPSRTPLPAPRSTPAVAAVPPQPEPAPAPAPAPAEVSKAPAASDPIARILVEGGNPQHLLVLEIQTELQSLGIYDGPLDGLDGPQTRAAIATFQERLGLVATGIVSELLLGRLRDDLPAVAGSSLAGAILPPSVTESGQGTASSAGIDPKVAAVQRVLADIGYAPGAIDGLMGRETRDAIQAFQVDRGLPPTGDLTDRLIQELEAFTGEPIV